MLEKTELNREMVDTAVEAQAHGAEAGSPDWQERHQENARIKEGLRRHFHTIAERSEQAKRYYRPAKPIPAIDDGTPKRVAAYTRVSTSSIEQVSSIENQTLYYTKKIGSTPNWQLHAIYSDEGKSGTSMRYRTQFKQMLADARAKRFDLIICASVSRFARNVSDCLEQISALKTMNPSHPVGVFFETENIYSLNPDSDQALALHALLADWESGNKSRRMILSYDQRILTGQYPVADLLGYRHTKEGELIVVPEEAKTVRMIFLAFLLGYRYGEIAEMLTQKRRPTLRGRLDWNGGMVSNIMNNERRWGALEARKRIVVDYKKGKTTRNRSDRCSAYSPEHHEAIVSPEIAAAINCIRKSSHRHAVGLTEMAVIPSGMLKGFISVVPAWNGVSNEAFHIICRSVYDDAELERLHQYMQLVNGTDHTNVIPMELSGYEVPFGVGYLSNGMPSLTIHPNRLLLNAACHKRFADVKHIEMLYHPILQTIVIRESSPANPVAIPWVLEDGTPVTKLMSRAFSQAVYENMCWKKDYAFRFRGITKERNGARIMLFYLDEPQILLSQKQKQKLVSDGCDPCQRVAYIPYRESPECEETAVAAAYGYPEEWNHSIGMSYELRAKRDSLISRLTDTDIHMNGMVVENPVIGHIPRRDELQEEFEQLLQSMEGG